MANQARNTYRDPTLIELKPEALAYGRVRLETKADKIRKAVQKSARCSRRSRKSSASPAFSLVFAAIIRPLLVSPLRMTVG